MNQANHEFSIQPSDCVQMIKIECNYEHVNKAEGYIESIVVDHHFVQVFICDLGYRTVIGSTWFEQLYQLLEPIVNDVHTFHFDRGRNPYWTITFTYNDGSTTTRTEMIGAYNMNQFHQISDFIRKSLNNQTLWLFDNRRFFYPLVNKLNLKVAVQSEDVVHVHEMNLDRKSLSLVYRHIIYDSMDGKSDQGFEINRFNIMGECIIYLLNDLSTFDYTNDQKRFDSTRLLSMPKLGKEFTLMIESQKGYQIRKWNFEGTYRTLFLPSCFENVLLTIHNAIQEFNIPKVFADYYRDMKMGELVVYRIRLELQFCVHATYPDMSLLYTEKIRVRYKEKVYGGTIESGIVINDLNDKNVPTIDAQIIDTMLN